MELPVFGGFVGVGENDMLLQTTNSMKRIKDLD